MKTLWLDTIDSTNSEALRRLPDLPSCTVLAAREQTAGRGQRGNTWFSEPGKNLTFSIVLKFGPGAVSAWDAHYLNCLASLSVVSLLDSFGIRSQIKWPNDIYVGKRKICGMLLENTLCTTGLAASVIGIGLNVNQTAFPRLANATSVALELGQVQLMEWDLAQTLECLLRLFEERLPLLSSPEGRQELMADYTARLFQKDVPAPYRDLLQDREFTGVIEGVEPDGRLRVRDAEGGKRFFRFKEISYLL
jgi:BirA family biotin operon repressor/biotin-[acetyl-CoA-carboxylase] ligase